jgi:REP element-mobilizing transposase RayT
MARPLRIEYEGALYHVTARGNERKRIYFTKTDYGKFREYIEGAQEKYGCLLHAYVFMINHMIIETPKPNIMKRYTGMTNGQIGQIFNGLTFSAVAKAYYRMAKAVEENRAMRKKIGKIISALS